MSLAQYSKEELQEFSLIELAYEFMKNSKQPIAFSDLVQKIAAAAGISEQEIRTRLAQLYTELNIDGRFLTLGENRWGLRLWYPVDTAEEEVISATKPKKKKSKKVVDEEDIYDEVEDAAYDEIDDFEDEDEDDLLEDEEIFDDELDDVDEFDEDEDVLAEDEDFELDEEDDLDEDLNEEDTVELDNEDEEEDL